jgi:hypothetical protein
MKLKPEEHRKAAADLQRASKPDEKQYLLDIAKILESLATVAEKRFVKHSGGRRP